MKKVISLFMAIAILLASAVSVFATGDYTIEKKDIYYLRSDGSLYNVIAYTEKATIELVDTAVVLCGSIANGSKDYLRDDYKEYFKSMNTLVFTEIGMVYEDWGYLSLNEEDAIKEIPNLTDVIGYDLYLAEDGKVYKYNTSRSCLYCIVNIGKMKDFQECAGNAYILSEDNTLYSTNHGGIIKVATDVKDFKVSNNSALYRTNNDDLYVSHYNWEATPEFLLSNCSQLYFYSDFMVAAKTNDGKWCHMGSNADFKLEPQRKVDGNNITPTEFKTMVEATEYIFRYGVWEWNIDGNLYCCLEGSRDLIAENVLMFDGTTTTAVTQDGDLVVFIKKSGNLMGDFLDANIKEPEKLATINASTFINKDNNLVVILKNDEEKRSYLQEIKLGEKYPDRSDWAEPEIAQADEIGYIDSVKQIPMQNNIKREEFCNMIVDFCEKYLGKELSTTSNPFKDTENEKVVKAYANGIITGISSNEFASNNEITREQMCAIMTRASKFLKPDVQFGEGIKFSDMNQVSDWAVEGVNAMSGLGIVKGDGVSITPKSNTSVEQSIAMTYRLYNKIK